MYVPLTLKLQAMHAPEFASLGICRMAERRFLHREQSLRRGKRVEDIVGGMTAAVRLLLALVYLLALPVWANQSLDLLAPPEQELGEHATIVGESATAWTPKQALEALQQEGTAGKAKVLSLGIGRPTQWLQLDVNNPTEQPLTRQLLVGQSWLDHIDVWVLRDDAIVRHWKTGDEMATQPGLDEVHGYKFEHMFAPGPHRLLVRVHTIDQLTINLRLRTPNQADSEASLDRYLYGFLYGFIASLAAYNLMLFAGLRKRVYLLYALYLLSFLLLNLAYTGRGAVWLWGEWVSVQRFSIVSLIVLMPSLGLLFSRAFLELPQLAPGLDRWLRLFTWIGPALLLVTMITGAYEAAVWLAFVVLGLFIFSMVGLGVHAVRRGQPAAQFFLLGAICSMVGTALTEFSVWGFIPYSVWAYRGIEIGMMLDATLLALALAKYVRAEVTQRQVAEITKAQLQRVNVDLEARVAQRTAEVENTLRQLEHSRQELARSEARATLSTMIASLSHELGTPLGNSLMAASTVADATRQFETDVTSGTLQRSTLNGYVGQVANGMVMVESNLGRANELLKNFRQVAADQASEQRREFDVSQVLTEVVHTLAPSLKRHPHRVVLEVPPGITMDSQPGPLGQIVINLINNAYLHAFEGIAKGVLTIAARLDGDTVELLISDNGVGIPAENLEKLFQPFFSTKIGKGGTGLGMAIVENLVIKTLAGSVAVESTLGQGTRFVIRLPKILPSDTSEEDR